MHQGALCARMCSKSSTLTSFWATVVVNLVGGWKDSDVDVSDLERKEGRMGEVEGARGFIEGVRGSAPLSRRRRH
jgi:hypothetical protein